MTAQGRTKPRRRSRPLSPDALFFALTLILSAAVLSQAGALLKATHHHFEHNHAATTHKPHCGPSCTHPPTTPNNTSDQPDNDNSEDHEDCATCTALDHSTLATNPFFALLPPPAYIQTHTDHEPAQPLTRNIYTQRTRGPPRA